MDLHKLAAFLEQKIVLASLQSYVALANVAKATGALARMSNLFDAAGPIDIYEAAESPKLMIAMLDSTARNLYMKAYQSGVSRSDAAGAMGKMMDLVDKIHAAAQNTKGQDNTPLDPQFWGKLADVKTALGNVVPVDIAPQNPEVKKDNTVDHTDSQSDAGNARKMDDNDPALSDVVDDLVNKQETKNPWDQHWDNYLGN